ncbi:MAG: hypothetical protein EXQ59_01810 [Acidobacteria bacterium]|nr:hypothetical protein [Acidobacteriota bacterium]
MRQVAIAALLAAVVAAGAHWGTFVAGGSDSYCYAHQAERWASGLLQVVEPLALEAPWPDAPRTFAPAGHAASATVPGAIVPICPAGLSMAMAPLLLLGGRDAIFFVVPIFGALLVGATFILGSRYGSRIGVVSALLVACSPAFLYQLMQPMSDVPAAALWIAAVAAATGQKRRAPLLAGLAAGAAIVMRPNLVPLGVPIGLFLLCRAERTWRERMHAAGTYAACCAAGCATVALVQNAYYGTPLGSEYGPLDALFSVDHIRPNARRYFTWMTATQTPAWLLAGVAPMLLPGALSALLAVMVGVTIACYLPYTVFDDWSYLRFLLAAIPLLLVLMVAAIDAGCRRAVGWWAGTPAADPQLVRHCGVALAVLGVGLGALGLGQARDRQVFRLHLLEARYVRAGLFVSRRLPPDSLIVTSWESGSVRFYSGRRTLVWDELDPAWLDRAILFGRQRRLEPFLLLERWEEPLFRARFAGSEIGRLDWPPMAEIGGQVRVYRPDDRSRYLRGEMSPTEYAR